MSRIWKSAWAKLLVVGIMVAVLVMSFSPINVSVTSSGGNPLSIGNGQLSLKIGNPAYATGSLDYVTDGVADNVEWAALFAVLSSHGGGVANAISSNYTFAAAVTVPANVVVRGSGSGFTFSRDGVNPIFIASAGDTFYDITTDAGGITTLSDTILFNVNGNTPTGRPTGYVIAASDAPALARSQADLLVPASGWETAVQTAITNNAGSKITFFGTFIKSTVAGLGIASNTTIDIQGKFTFITNVGNGATMFTPTTNSTGWSIINGVIDGNKANQPMAWRTNEQVAIATTNVSNCKVDTLIQNFYGENIKETTNGVGNSFVNRAYPKSVAITERKVALNPNSMRLIDSMDSGWTKVSGNTLTYDTTTFMEGNAAVNLLIDASTTGNISKTGNWTFPANAQFGVMALIYPSNQNGFKSFTLELDAPDAANSITMIYHAGVNQVISTFGQDWRILDFNQANTGNNSSTAIFGTPNMSNVQKISLYVENWAEGNRIFYDKLFWNLPMFPNGLLTIASDDGFSDIATVLRPLMDAYGYKGVVAANGGSIGTAGKLTLTQLRQLKDGGWEIGNHAYNHENSYQQPKSVIEDGIRKNQDYLISNGLGEGNIWIGTNAQMVDYYAYPIVSKYTIGARSRSNFTNSSIFVNNFPTFDVYEQYNINPFDSAAVEIPATLALMDKAAQYGGWVQVYVHQSTGWSTNITSILSRANSLGMKVVTYSEAMELASMPITTSSGNATIPSGSTSIVQKHWLKTLPSIQLTAMNNTTNATRAWYSNVNSDNFTINTNVDPGASGAIFQWTARE